MTVGCRGNDGLRAAPRFEIVSHPNALTAIYEQSIYGNDGTQKARPVIPFRLRAVHRGNQAAVRRQTQSLAKITAPHNPMLQYWGLAGRLLAIVQCQHLGYSRGFQEWGPRRQTQSLAKITAPHNPMLQYWGLAGRPECSGLCQPVGTGPGGLATGRRRSWPWRWCFRNSEPPGLQSTFTPRPPGIRGNDEQGSREPKDRAVN